MQRDFGNQDNVGEVDELTMAPQRPAKNAEAKSKGRMQPLPRRQESGPMSRLHIDVGQAHDVTPRALVGAITGESGIPGRSVGAIDIQNNFSIVEISAELAAHVLATLNKGVFISGVKVSAKAADETDSPHPRKPFAPASAASAPASSAKNHGEPPWAEKPTANRGKKRASSFRGQSAGSAGTTPPLFLGGAAKAYDGASEIRQAWTRGRKRRAARHLLVYGQL